MRKRFTVFLLFTVVALAGCEALRPTPASMPEPTLDPAHWSVYQDLEHHFSFAYPKSYDLHPLCAPQVKPGDLSSPDFSVSLNNSNIKVTLTPLSDPKQTDPQSAVDSLRSFWSGTYQVSFDDPVKRSVAGLPAISQRYTTVYNKNGFLISTFFIKNGILYTVYLNSPATCDGYPDTPPVDQAYERVLTSFHIQ